MRLRWSHISQDIFKSLTVSAIIHCLPVVRLPNQSRYNCWAAAHCGAILPSIRLVHPILSWWSEASLSPYLFVICAVIRRLLLQLYSFRIIIRRSSGAVFMETRSLSSFLVSFSQCSVAQTSVHSKTCSLVSLSCRHRGHLLCVHFLRISIMRPTAQCPEACFESHIWREKGSRFIANSVFFQSIKWISCTWIWPLQIQ